MVEPLTAAAGLAKVLGPHVARLANEWRKGSEAKRLVDSLKKEHPAAEKMLLQPAVLGHLWAYAQTGELDEDGLVHSLRTITPSEAHARALADAVRTGTWRSVKDDRRVHFDLLRLQAEMREERGEEHAVMLARIDAMVSAVARRLPVARQLPAEVSAFVDRDAELAVAERALAMTPADQGAIVLCCSGMAGMGKTALALRIAHGRAKGFTGGVLHVDMRDTEGRARRPGEVAARLLRDLGVAAEAMPASDDAKLGLLRSLLASEPALLLLDDAVDEDQIRNLIPANPEAVVIVTSRSALAGLGRAQIVVLDDLADEDGVKLLRTFLGSRVDAEPDEARAIVVACHGLPLALAVVGARLRRTPRRPLRDVAERLRAGGDALEVLDDRERAIASALRSDFDSLSPMAQRLLMLVAALEVSDIEPAIVATLLECSSNSALDVLEELESAQLLRRSQAGSFTAHDLIRSTARALGSERLGQDELASAQQRRVDWLVESGDQQVRDMGGDQ